MTGSGQANGDVARYEDRPFRSASVARGVPYTERTAPARTARLSCLAGIIRTDDRLSQAVGAHCQARRPFGRDHAPYAQAFVRFARGRSWLCRADDRRAYRPQGTIGDVEVCALGRRRAARGGRCGRERDRCARAIRSGRRPSPQFGSSPLPAGGSAKRWRSSGRQPNQNQTPCPPSSSTARPAAPR
jgi:hypothetical protein